MRVSGLISSSVIIFTGSWAIAGGSCCCGGAVKARGMAVPANSLYLHVCVGIKGYIYFFPNAYYVIYLHCTDVVCLWDLRVEIVTCGWVPDSCIMPPNRLAKHELTAMIIGCSNSIASCNSNLVTISFQRLKVTLLPLEKQFY